MPCFDCDDGPCYMNCGPARRAAVIRTAYAISHKGGLLTYRARAYVEDNGGWEPQKGYQFGGRYQTVHAALAWFDWLERQQ